MRALVHDRYGSADTLRWEDLPAPTTAADQVLVRVEAASVNAADLDFLRGRPAVMKLASGLRGPRNRRLGVDVAGRVEAVGDDVTRFAVGDAVFGDLFSFGMGSFAELVCAPERAFLRVPESVSLAEAATLPHAGILALQGLRAGKPMRSGERFLINGASGNVGPFAIQIAKSLGMHVTGVASADKLDFVRSIGAAEVLDYATTDYTRLGRRWDRILDVNARRSLFGVRRAVAPGGVYTWIGGTTPTLAQAMLLGVATKLAGGRRIGFTMVWKPFHEPDVLELLRMMEAGTLRPVIDRTYPFDQAIEAVRYVEEGRHRGKVVVVSATSR